MAKLKPKPTDQRTRVRLHREVKAWVKLGAARNNRTVPAEVNFILRKYYENYLENSVRD